jgi:hypothetical protein
MQVGHVVYGNDIEFFFVTLEHRSQPETADPTETIDRYIGHLSSCRFWGEVVAGLNAKVKAKSIPLDQVCIISAVYP